MSTLNSPHATRFSQRSGSNNTTPLGSPPYHFTPVPLVQPAKLTAEILEKLSKVSCPVCKNECLKLEQAVCCEICEQWYHATCIDMSRQTYNVHRKPNIAWFCTQCLEKKKKWVPNGTDQSARMAETMERIAKTMDKHWDRIELMEEKMATKEDLKNFEKKVDARIDSKIEDGLQERLEREQRKLSLIFVNVKESDGDRERRMERDIEKAKELVEEILPAEEAKKIELKRPVRLGPEQAGKRPRFLKIEVQSEEEKWKILKNAYKLNEGKDWSDPTRQYINMDFTEKERQKNKLLREELRMKKQSDPSSHWKIKGGQVVKVDGAGKL